MRSSRANIKTQEKAKPAKTLPSDVSLPQPSINPSELITIARIIRPQGIKGEVIATIETDFPERFEDLSSVFLVFPDNQIKELELIDFWFHKDRIVFAFESINSRNEAELLRNVTVKVPASEIVDLPEDHYYEFDLIGCQVITNNGQVLGQVKSLLQTGAAPLLVVNGAKEYLIPLAEDICTEINTEEKKIIVNPPEGLLDL
ncbi:MAG: 16S rRNA processing protein RimM [Acidobacteria bacterium]|nr:16S rRNA processing protein RimM [Acidobacteriota bacterium]